MKTSEPFCVIVTRRGAEHVATEIAGLSGTEEIEYWQRCSRALRTLQESVSGRARQPNSAPNQGFERTAESSGALRD
jgi:hypothetical protein